MNETAQAPKKKVQKVTIEAEYRFNSDELLELGSELASKHQELATLESSKKDYAAQIKSEAAAVESTIALLSRKISTGKEFREFLCQVEFDMDSRIKHYVAIDTGDVVKSVPMTAHDMQQQLDLEEELQDEDEEEDEDEVVYEQSAGQEQALLPAPSVDAEYTVVDDEDPMNTII